MAAKSKQNDLLIRLSPRLRFLIEEAALHLGQTLIEFATATLVDSASRILQQQRVTELTNRDRDAFIAILNDVDAVPNKALKSAVRDTRNLLVNRKRKKPGNTPGLSSLSPFNHH